MENEDGKRVIKKYPNRRLYDTTESKYVTLNDVRQLVLDGIPFCVIDKKRGDDITRNILLQIIIEQEEEGEPLFSSDMLEKMIGFYGHSLQGAAGDFLNQSLQLFEKQHDEFQNRFKDTIQANPMSAVLNEVTKKNIEIWKEMQSTFFATLETMNKNSRQDDS